MTPEKKKQVGKHKVEEYYWAGEYPIYINNRLTSLSFDGAVKWAEENPEGEHPDV